MEEFPEDVLTSMFAYLDEGQSKKALIELSLPVQVAMSKYANSNDYWKKKVETLIGWYIGANIIRDWKQVYKDMFSRKAELMSRACEHGYTEIVELLLKDQSIDPNIGSMEPLSIAVIRGYIEIVRLLLMDKRVMPRKRRQSLLLAVKGGHTAIVQLLLSNPLDNPAYSVNPAYNDNEAVKLAAGQSAISILELLLHTEGVDPSADSNRPIQNAAAAGIIEAVKLLLADKRVSPQAEENYAIRTACAKGHGDVVKLLLTDHRVDPAALNNDALLLASTNNHPNVVEILLAHPRVDPSADNAAIVKTVFFNRHKKVLMVLLSSPKIPLLVKQLFTFDGPRKIINEYIGKSISLLIRVLDDPRANKDVIKILKSKYFWWARLELIGGVSSVDIIAMDNDVNPMELCVIREQNDIIIQ